MENDILCLRVTNVSNKYDVPDIIEQLPSFEVHLNSYNDRFQNIGFCLGKDIKVNQYQQLPRASILEIRKIIFCSGFASILLL